MSDIVFLSHTPRASTFRVGSHHLSLQMALLGHRVAHISTPLSLVHRALGRGTRERRRAAARGVHWEGPVVEYIPRPLLPADLHWSTRSYRAALDAVRIPEPDFVFVDQPLFAVPDFGSGIIILRPTDLFTSARLRNRARRILTVADGVAATSQNVLDDITAPRPSIPSIVLENGVDLSRFLTDNANRTGADFVYVGALDDRFDFEGVRHLAAYFKDRRFDLYGPLDVAAPSLGPNVNFLGAVPYEEVPSILANARVGLLPLVSTPLNRGRSPMKLYEFIAAGLSVVAPDYLADRAGLERIHGYDATSKISMIEAAACALASPPPTPLDTATIAEMDWRNVARRLLAFAESCRR